MRRLIAYGTTAAAVGAAGLLLVVTGGGQATAASSRAEVQLRDAWGKPVADVTFSRHAHDDSTLVEAVFFARKSVAKNAFHGFHVHANDDSANGTGCDADPDDAPDTWFVSADGHYTGDGEGHGSHKGDMPSVLVQRNGGAHLVFTTDRFDPRDVVGKAVVLHAKADNFGNVPVGDADDQYEADDGLAVEKTSKTGNAGDRIACGVVKRR